MTKRGVKWTPRGATGTIRGMSAEAATKVLVSLVQALEPVSSKKRRAEAGRILRGRWGFQEEMVDGIILALERLPGFRKGAAGELLFPRNAVAHARHREWRIASGQLNLAQATEAAKLLAQAKDPGLIRLAERLRAASAPLLGE